MSRTSTWTAFRSSTRRASSCTSGAIAATGDGELDGVSGIAIDGEDCVYVSDTHNGRVQKFTTDGGHVLAFGRGELDLPWGLTVAPSGDVYVADWGNDRIARFSPTGELVGSYGRPGRGDGELRRPASVAVDDDGYIYVADWGNERVQVLDPEGGFVMKTRGEATLSKWAANFLRINNEEADARSRADLEPEIDLFDPDDPHEESSQIEKALLVPHVGETRLVWPAVRYGEQPPQDPDFSKSCLTPDMRRSTIRGGGKNDSTTTSRPQPHRRLLTAPEAGPAQASTATARARGWRSLPK